MLPDESLTSLPCRSHRQTATQHHRHARRGLQDELLQVSQTGPELHGQSLRKKSVSNDILVLDGSHQLRSQLQTVEEYSVF